jgi:hypothetical protein
MKQLLAVFFILTVMACSNTPPIVKDQSGRMYPTPNYTLQDIRGRNLSSIFYFTLFIGEKDLDGSVQTKPTYLNMLKHNELPKGSRVTMTIEISNPQKVKYSLWERVQYIKVGSNTNLSDAKGGRIAVSNLDYRQYVYELPTTPDLNTVNYGIDVIGDDGAILFHIGDFNYTVSGAAVIKSSVSKEPEVINNVKGGLTEEERKKLGNNN